MTIENIMTLVNAGFTKDEIRQMMGVGVVEQTTESIQPVAEVVEERPVKSDGDISKILAGLDGLTKAIYASNLLNTEQVVNNESSLDVFAKILGGDVNNGK